MFAVDQFMGMNALFNSTNYITSDLPLRTGRNPHYLMVLLSCWFFLFVLRSSFQSLFLFTNLCHNSRLQSCQLDFFITSFCISFFPSWSFQQWAKSDFLVACTETESCSSFPGETRTVTKGLWVTWFYKLLCWGFFRNLHLQWVTCFCCWFADCYMCFFSFWMLLHLL